MKYQVLIPAIKAVLASVSEIKEVAAHPAQKISKYPAAIFYPVNVDNSFEDTADNMKIYNFKLFVVVGVGQTTIENVFTTILPKAVDAVMAKFDAEWDGGNIDGHRVIYLLNSAEWGMSPTEQGLEAYAEFNLQIKLLTSN